MNLLDDHQYHIPKFFAFSGPFVFKRTNHSTYRSFQRTSSHLSITAPQLVTQSTQADPPSAIDHTLARAFLRCWGPAAVGDYHHGRPFCMVDIDQIAPS